MSQKSCNTYKIRLDNQICIWHGENNSSLSDWTLFIKLTTKGIITKQNTNIYLQSLDQSAMIYIK